MSEINQDKRLKEIGLEYMNVIPNPPRTPDDLHNQACSADGVTISRWRDEWMANTKTNHQEFGPFKDRPITSLFNQYKHRPVICVGSGPSLAKNVDQLKDTGGIPIISCLHNFHYMVDNGVPVDYYVTLDAGKVTIEEVYEGAQNPDPEYYWEKTKDCTLLAYTASHPDLLRKWKGKILFFTAPIPDQKLYHDLQEIEPFSNLLSTGGNVLGGCVYAARLMGAGTIVFVGADFSFAEIPYLNEKGELYRRRQFHPWKSKYDGNIGEAMRTVDIYGNKVLTWQSYWNFAQFFSWMACSVPGVYINATEGGVFGAYPDGVIQQVKQMKLSEVIAMYRFNDAVKHQADEITKTSFNLMY